ncbi:LysM-like peptidoglycan-binding domain-containing protein [Glaesserella parasuis]|uniref:LysM-like peptidoglycan-binding domain-containing protein n=1 Tax=Glaesserella parasuis TaxID=738 RepID=UPI0007A00F62|nr:LysM-like peptidoglycan-binding domain-containing protein [Glaesserella parasuis]AMW17036.1 3-ketoacyl-ACP reductase [Glaesserella parasuis]MDG6271314.1 LysM-like peptidoglycan-binding domain-containing protein [Glaesserella parasuis]MDG6307332.1 LysM-like peptidoglycan-binding domain-containing protein [Glaesserella parasuis]MDG6343022.1 LysM-like peptidoglycan-binding domain-containing protein [Glaesserella parasuis]MDP0168140.1 LysM-like peptidoglycan-binding domain-containing protein [G
MSQQNLRKEPVFGEPSAVKTENENSESKLTLSAHKLTKKVNFSLHSTKSPGHTFTPVMKRPVGGTFSFASMEEQKNQQDSKERTLEQQKTSAFMFSPVVTTTEEPLSEAPQKETETTNAEQPAMTTQTIERILPSSQPNFQKSIAEKVPFQSRRLLLVGVLVLASLLILFLLKPNTPETLEQLEQDNTLPIEFRPVDEAEAKRAEEAKALTIPQASPISPPVNTVETILPLTTGGSTVSSNVENASIMPISVTSTEITKPTEEVVTKPTSSGSVSYQMEEEKSEVEKIQAEKTQVEKIKPVSAVTQKAEVNIEKEQPAKTKVVVVTAKPVVTSASSGFISSKTLTIPKGVSLMQVFRDNHLNISDVNAMSKANKAVSNLKVGEKVTVRLDKNSRVVEMRINAGIYTRQSNGTYIFK